MDFVEHVEDEYGRCRKHPWESRTGVCPICLKNRLILLCPHCANVRPCLCYTTSSSSASSASSSSSDLSVGRISFLIDSEPPFRRSRSSAAFHFVRHRPGADSASTAPAGCPHPLQREKRRWISSLALLLSFSKAEKPKNKAQVEGGKKTAAMGSRLTRSRSMGFACYSDPDGIHGGDVRLKGWGWLSSPIKVFRQPKHKPAKILQERSLLCRG